MRRSGVSVDALLPARPRTPGSMARISRSTSLIWKRTVGQVRLAVRPPDHAQAWSCRWGSPFPGPAGKAIDFAGFLPRLCGKAATTLMPRSKGQEGGCCRPLVVGDPPLQAGSMPRPPDQPPGATAKPALVPRLFGESKGIGPAFPTYASIIATIVDAVYATLANNSLTPSFTAFAVTAAAEEPSPDLVDTGFNRSRMEPALKMKIPTGKEAMAPYLNNTSSKGDQGAFEDPGEQREGEHDPTASRTIAN